MDRQPSPDATPSADDLRALDDTDRLAGALDFQFVLPLTSIRFGWDPILGLVPIAGDLASLALSLRVLSTARTLGVSPPVLRRMAYNAAVDAVVGLIPIAGTVFDIYFKANMQNVALLLEDIARRRTEP